MAILTVGPSGQQYTTIAAAVAAAQNGDVVQVQAGTYVNDFATVTTKITIQGVGGMVNIVATEAPPNGRGVLETQTDTTLDHISISGAVSATSNNGAGLFHVGGNLSVNASYFHNDQDGVLIGPDVSAIGSVLFLNSEFGFNGVSGAVRDNLNVGSVASLTVEDSYFHDVTGGHEIVSGANSTLIQNNVIADGPNSTASYSVDLFNGGADTITGNVIEKGLNAVNGSFIHLGGGATTTLSVSNNTILADTTHTLAVLLLNQAAAGVTPTITGNSVYTAFSFGYATGAASVSGNATLATEPGYSTADPFASAPEIDFVANAAHEVTSQPGGSVSLFGGFAFTAPYDGQVTVTISGWNTALGVVAYAGSDSAISVQASNATTLVVTGLASAIAADFNAGLFQYDMTAQRGADQVQVTVANPAVVLDLGTGGAGALETRFSVNLEDPYLAALPNVGAAFTPAVYLTLQQALEALSPPGTTPNVVSVAGGGSAGTPIGGRLNALVYTSAASGSTVTLPSGFAAGYLFAAAVTLQDMNGGSALIDTTAGSTLIGSANDTLFGANAGATLIATSGAETLIGGTGSNSFVLGSSTATVISQGTDIITGSSGAETVNASGSALYFGTSGATTFNASATSTGSDTIIGGNNGNTINGGGGGQLIFGSSSLVYTGGGGAATVIGGGNGNTVTGGSGNLLLFASSSMTYTGTAGAATLIGGGGPLNANMGPGGGVVYGSPGGNDTLNSGSGTSIMVGGGGGDLLTATGSANDTLVAGGGAETINGSASSGALVIFGGPGSDVLSGGAGNDLFIAESGNETLTGGGGTNSYILISTPGTARTDVITDFDPTRDAIGLFGYGAEPGADAAALASATSSGGNTTVSLTDGTSIVFTNAPTLHAYNFF